MTKNLEVLEKMYANHRKIKGDCLPVHDNLETLLQYCEDHPLGAGEGKDPAIINPVELVRAAGHLEIAEAVAEVIVAGSPADKVRTVWIYGAADSGKSTAIDLVEEIFCIQEVQFNA